MLWYTLSALLALAGQDCLAQPDTRLSLRLVTFNIRYADTGRSLAENEKPWSTRGPLVADTLNEILSNAHYGAATIFGLQEVLYSQLVDLKQGLGRQWAHIGVGRSDGREAGEYSPILYRPDTLRLLYNETKWLSPTPDAPSIGWGASLPRIITVGLFEHIQTGVRFIASNTHLDQSSSRARIEGSKTALRILNDLEISSGAEGIFMTGDFNAGPNEDGYLVLEYAGMQDAYLLVGESRMFGPYATDTGFVPGRGEKRIDMIWLDSTENRWEVERYEVLSNVRGGVYVSDHRPVVADVRLVV